MSHVLREQWLGMECVKVEATQKRTVQKKERERERYEDERDVQM